MFLNSENEKKIMDAVATLEKEFKEAGVLSWGLVVAGLNQDEDAATMVTHKAKGNSLTCSMLEHLAYCMLEKDDKDVKVDKEKIDQLTDYYDKDKCHSEIVPRELLDKMSVITKWLDDKGYAEIQLHASYHDGRENHHHMIFNDEIKRPYIAEFAIRVLSDEFNYEE